MAPITNALLAARAMAFLVGCSSPQSDTLLLVMTTRGEATPNPRATPFAQAPAADLPGFVMTRAERVEPNAVLSLRPMPAPVTWPLAAVILSPIPQPIATGEDSPGQLAAPAVWETRAYPKIGFHTAPNGGGRGLGDWLQALNAAGLLDEAQEPSRLSDVSHVPESGYLVSRRLGRDCPTHRTAHCAAGGVWR